MYIDGSYPGLGISIKISDVSVDPSVIDPNKGCWITRCTFLLTHIIPWAESFHVFSFDDAEEKVAWGLKVKRVKM